MEEDPLFTINNTRFTSIQLKQHLLYYRSEMQKYKSRIKKLERRLDKEKLEEDLKIEEEQAKKPQGSEISAHAFLSYTLFLPKDAKESDPTIHAIGHYHFKNTGTVTLVDPFICFKVSPSTNVQLGGKIDYKKDDTSFSNMLAPLEKWQYIQENWKDVVADKGEHWLKPMHVKKIEPGETASFQQFDFTFSPQEDHSRYVVDAFFYAVQIPHGIKSDTSISFYYK
ncbi:hypothetical protein [Salipaludibacillus sp. CF4.18]|uniref:hypothetical protein n=1 Tax=Salipaludibacillus sp. CF4.18 TaxID=3373081 RepID=UPI003EE69A40